MVKRAFLCSANGSFMLCRKNKPSKRGCFCSQSEKRCSASHGKSLEDVVGSIASKGCMTFIRQNTLDPPTCKLFDASLTCQFMLTFPLIAFLGAMMGFSCQRHVDEVQDQLSQISSIPWFTKVGHELFNAGIYSQQTKKKKPGRIENSTTFQHTTFSISKGA
jgi:hypothetical protein